MVTLVLATAGTAAGVAAAQQSAFTAAEQAAIDRAREALEARHEWTDGLTVESVKATEWRDSSLGCRQPGVSYMQVIMPGYIVRFTGKDARREVHVAGDRTAVCGGVVSETLKTPSPRVPLRNLDEMIDKARADLAMRLNGKPSDVTLAGWAPLRLPARVLRCEVARGDAAGEPAVPGYRIVLGYRGRQYTYQSDMQTVTACPRIEAS